jgi:hypothetical protein
VTATFTVPNSAQPADFTLRAESRNNAILIRAQCSSATAAVEQPAWRQLQDASFWMPTANAPAAGFLASLLRLVVTTPEDGDEIAKS